MSIKELADRILADGKLTEAEHKELQEAIQADGHIDASENEQVTRILDMVRSGELKVR